MFQAHRVSQLCTRRSHILFAKKVVRPRFSNPEYYQFVLHELKNMAHELRNRFEEHVCRHLEDDNLRRCVETTAAAYRMYTNGSLDRDI